MRNISTRFAIVEPQVLIWITANVAWDNCSILTRWSKDQFELMGVFWFEEEGLRQFGTEQVQIILTVGAAETEGFALGPTRVAREGTVWIRGHWVEGQWVGGMRWVQHGPRSIEAGELVEKELARWAAVEWLVVDRAFAGFAFEFFAVVQFDGYQDVLVAEMLLTFVPHSLSPSLSLFSMCDYHKWRRGGIYVSIAYNNSKSKHLFGLDQIKMQFL